MRTLVPLFMYLQVYLWLLTRASLRHVRIRRRGIFNSSGRDFVSQSTTLFVTRIVFINTDTVVQEHARHRHGANFAHPHAPQGRDETHAQRLLERLDVEDLIRGL
jgi:hypothetical protein